MKRILIITALVLAIFSCKSNAQENKRVIMPKEMENNKSEDLGIATFGNGCFWCTEAIFLELKGVTSVKSGYSGGHVKNPSYKEVVKGVTGHAEAIQIKYDPKQITYAEILEVFWSTHDPTTLNRQGNDIGTQYRSVIFYHNQDQKQQADTFKKRLNDEKVFQNPVVTEISAFSEFYVAEDYHQNYLANNPNQPYCVYVVQPKLDKFRKVFSEKLKD